MNGEGDEGSSGCLRQVVLDEGDGEAGGSRRDLTRQTKAAWPG